MRKAKRARAHAVSDWMDVVREREYATGTASSVSTSESDCPPSTMAPVARFWPAPTPWEARVHRAGHRPSAQRSLRTASGFLLAA